MFRYDPPLFWRSLLEARVHMQESIPSLALVAVLSALTAGCCSSFRPAGVAGFPDSQQLVGRTSLVSPRPDRVSFDQSAARPETTGAITPHVAASGHVSSRLPESPSPALTRLQSVDNDYPNDIGIARFDEDLPVLTRVPPLESLDTNSWPQCQAHLHDLFGDVLTDHRNYYSGGNLGALAVGVGVAAAMANTKLDRSLRNSYQKNVRDVYTDEYSEAIHTPTVLGNGYVAIPVFAGAALVGSWFDDLPLADVTGELAQRNLRTVLVGAPPCWRCKWSPAAPARARPTTAPSGDLFRTSTASADTASWTPCPSSARLR